IVRITVWDLPLRLFHWLLAAAVAGALITINLGVSWIEWHARFGLAVVGLIAFRLVWGVVGSTHSRFASFVPTPSAVASYVRGHRSEEHTSELQSRENLVCRLLLEKKK